MKLNSQLISGKGLNVPDKMESHQLGYLLHLIQSNIVITMSIRPNVSER